MKQILDELRREMAKGRGFFATIDSVDIEARTCEVKVTDENVPRDIRLPFGGVLLVPKKGTECFVQRIAPGVGLVVWFAQVEEIQLPAEGKITLKAEGKVEIEGSQVVMRNGTKGGIPVTDSITQALNALVTALNANAAKDVALATALAAMPPLLPFAPAFAPFVATPVVIPPFQAPLLENPNVTHG